MTHWCEGCGIHVVDDARYPKCPVCEDVDRKAADYARSQIGKPRRDELGEAG